MTHDDAQTLLADRSSTIAEIMARWPETGPALLAALGMRCMGCLMARFHTISDAAAAHGVDETRLRHVLVMAAQD